MRRVILSVIALALIVAGDIIDGPCIDKNGTKYSPGDTWKDSAPCEEYKCLQIGLAPMIEVTKCPNYTVNDPCYMKYYPYKVYPDCCPTPTCPVPSQPYIWNMNGHGK